MGYRYEHREANYCLPNITTPKRGKMANSD